MPYTTVVAGQVITASWANTNLRDQVVTRFANAAARDAAILAPLEGMYADLADVDMLCRYDGSRWTFPRQPFGATVATSQATTSTSFTDLTTPGPAVTVVTGTSALVTLTASLSCSVADGVYMGFAVSGATTLAADPTQSLAWVGTSRPTLSTQFLVTGLAAGSNTFTAKYRIAFSGTGTFADRSITVASMS